MSNIKLEVYVDASVKNNVAGIGLVIKRNGKLYKELRTIVKKCSNIHKAEEMAIFRGIELIKKNGTSPKKCKIYTDCKSLVDKNKGIIEGIIIEWIPRELNEAHDQSVLGRRRKSSKKITITQKGG